MGHRKEKRPALHAEEFQGTWAGLLLQEGTCVKSYLHVWVDLITSFQKTKYEEDGRIPYTTVKRPHREHVSQGTEVKTSQDELL